LSWRYLWSRPLAAALNLLLLTLGLAAITLVLLVATQLDRAFERDLAGIDLVVGAKGSPLQLILAGVFHIDVPTGNIPLQEVQALQKNPLVAQVIPLSLGDSYQGFRIVGTTPDYVAHYERHAGRRRAVAAAHGRRAGRQRSARHRQSQTMPAPLVGATFIGSHGLGGGGHAHGDHPYRVSGVLAPCGCVLDRLILTSTESVWQVHEAATADDPEDLEILKQEREVTVALVRYRTPLAAITLPRPSTPHLDAGRRTGH
jgi:putative ABC transport system permease protein